MKLIQISEAKDAHIIKHQSEAIGKLKTYITKYKNQKAMKAIEKIFSDPDISTWKQNSWIVTDTINNLEKDQKLDQTEKQSAIAQLKTILTTPSAIVISSLYSIPKEQLKDTALKNLNLSPSENKRLKKGLGPQGYIAALSSADNMRSSTLKKTLLDISKNSDSTSQSIRQSIPGVNIVKDF